MADVFTPTPHIADRVPRELVESLSRYFNQRIRTGGFLEAVLKNDLKEAVGRADEFNALRLRDIVSLLYHDAPAFAWGAPDRVEKWLAGGPVDE